MTWHTLLQLLLVVLVGLVVAFIISRDDNDLQYADLVSSRGIDGKQHASWNNIGKGLAAVMSFFIPMHYAFSDKFDPLPGAGLMVAALAYLGAVDGYSAYLRSRQSLQQTTVTTEPPVDTKTTTTTTTPIAQA